MIQVTLQVRMDRNIHNIYPVPSTGMETQNLFVSWHNLCWHFRVALWSCLGSGPPSNLDMAVNLWINSETSIDAILLMM